MARERAAIALQMAARRRLTRAHSVNELGPLSTMRSTMVRHRAAGGSWSSWG